MDVSRITACTYPLRDKDLDTTFGVIAGAGFERVDLLARMPHFSVTDPAYSIDELERLCGKHGLSVANIGSYCGRGFSAPEETERAAAVEEMDRTLEAAHRLGARSIRISPGGGKRAEIDGIVPHFQKAAEKASRYGIFMGIENHGSEISGNPAVCREICEKVGSKHFGILYEPCNLMAAGTDYQEALEGFSRHVVHVHIKDGRKGAGGKWERTMLGEGEIDVRWVFGQMEALGYQGDYALEFEVGHIEPAETGYRKWYETWKEL